MKYNSLIILMLILWTACGGNKKSSMHPPLPVLGNKDVAPNGDTLYHTVPKFEYLNQDSQVVDNQRFKGKSYVVDFFFTSCPSICPKMSKQMLRIHDKYLNEDKLELVSFSIDPKRDSVGRLKEYAENLGIQSEKWHLLTGDKDQTMEIADDFFNVVIEDPDAPGGFDHSGRFILVDPKGHIRAFVSDGTVAEEVDAFFPKIDQLLAEMKKQ